MNTPHTQNPLIDGTHVMIDLETMGTGADAPIVSIGAVWFDRFEGCKGVFYTPVSLKSSVASGAVIDPDTVVWWLGQSDDARKLFTEEQAYALDLDVALQSLNSAVAAANPEGVWGNGASFDNTILAESYRRAGVTPAWKFWQDRCFRTMKNAYANLVPAPEREGTHHNALDDAKYQAAHLQLILNHMAEKE